MTRVAGESCASVLRRLSLLLGGDLQGAEDRRVRAHLRACARCRSELGIWIKVRRDLAALRGTPPERGRFDERFFARLEHDIHDRVGAARPHDTGEGRGSRLRLLRFLPGAAAAAALFAIGFLAGHRDPNPGSGDPNHLTSLRAQPALRGTATPVPDPTSRIRPVGFVGTGLMGRARVDQMIPYLDQPTPDELDLLFRSLVRRQAERARAVAPGVQGVLQDRRD